MPCSIIAASFPLLGEYLSASIVPSPHSIVESGFPSGQLQRKIRDLNRSSGEKLWALLTAISFPSGEEARARAFDRNVTRPGRSVGPTPVVSRFLVTTT